MNAGTLNSYQQRIFCLAAQKVIVAYTICCEATETKETARWSYLSCGEMAMLQAIPLAEHFCTFTILPSTQARNFMVEDPEVLRGG
jgi:bacteriorhodopsin